MFQYCSIQKKSFEKKLLNPEISSLKMLRMQPRERKFEMGKKSDN